MSNTERKELVADAIASGFSESDAELLAHLARPAARLVPRASDGGSVRSTIGGMPDLPPELDWPTGVHGPMTFCGQVRTDDVAFLHGTDEWRPEPGLLSFFADKDPDGDEVDAGRVFLLSFDSLTRRDPPGDLHAYSRFDETAVEAKPVWSLPPIELVWEESGETDEAAFDQHWDRLEERIWGPRGLTAGRHQLLGEPHTIDMDPLFIAAARLGLEAEDEDLEERDLCRLLAQFTTDEDLNIEIADAGAIYFILSRDDLATNCYDNVAVWMDCH